MKTIMFQFNISIPTIFTGFIIIIIIITVIIIIIIIAIIMNKTMYHKTEAKWKQSCFNSTNQSLQAFGGHPLNYQVHINTNR